MSASPSPRKLAFQPLSLDLAPPVIPTLLPQNSSPVLPEVMATPQPAAVHSYLNKDAQTEVHTHAQMSMHPHRPLKYRLRVSSGLWGPALQLHVLSKKRALVEVVRFEARAVTPQDGYLGTGSGGCLRLSSSLISVLAQPLGSGKLEGPS